MTTTERKKERKQTTYPGHLLPKKYWTSMSADMATEANREVVSKDKILIMF
jgi:hypothetical protein